MEEKLISIIVPVYNAQNYLKRCVDSIVNQTYGNLEIILVDDGAEDKSPEMCDAYAAADHRIEVIHKENGGLMSAWMAGVKKSRGDYLSFIDSDDWVETDMMEVMLQKTSGCPGELSAVILLLRGQRGLQSIIMSFLPEFMKDWIWRRR